MMMKRITCCYLLLLIVAAGCSTSETVRRPDEGAADPDTAAVDRTDERAMQQLLDASRSSLGDLYVTQQNDIPQQLLKEQEGDRQNVDPYAGYRVQILSTRSIEQADSAAGNFRVWADTTISGYQAETYQFFRQPFFKVHVGDFHDRERAAEFSAIVQRQWPDAWVVPDRIEPRRVPADSTDFELKDKNEQEESEE